MQICNSNPSVAFGASSLYTREPWGAQSIAFPYEGKVARRSRDGWGGGTCVYVTLSTSSVAFGDSFPS